MPLPRRGLPHAVERRVHETSPTVRRPFPLASQRIWLHGLPQYQHKSTVYHQGGIPESFSCNNCHPGTEANGFYRVAGMEQTACIDCHMPYMAKSAGAHNDYKADVHGHLFYIKTDTTMAANNIYEEGGNLYWDVDGQGHGYATLDYACLGCHVEIGADLTMAEAATYADDIHNIHPAAAEPLASAELLSLQLHNAYPNPFNPSTNLQFDVNKPQEIELTIYNVQGQMVATLWNGPASAGVHRVTFNGSNLSSGIYIARLSGNGEFETTKMVLMK